MRCPGSELGALFTLFGTFIVTCRIASHSEWRYSYLYWVEVWQNTMRRNRDTHGDTSVCNLRVSISRDVPCTVT